MQRARAFPLGFLKDLWYIEPSKSNFFPARSARRKCCIPYGFPCVLHERGVPFFRARTAMAQNLCFPMGFLVFCMKRGFHSFRARHPGQLSGHRAMARRAIWDVGRGGGRGRGRFAAEAQTPPCYLSSPVDVSAGSLRPPPAIYHCNFYLYLYPHLYLHLPHAQLSPRTRAENFLISNSDTSRCKRQTFMKLK